MAKIDMEPYRAALKERICAFCLDRQHDGTCNRPKAEPCAIESHLELLVEAVLKVGGSCEVTDYVESMRDVLCPNCRQDKAGNCPLRELADCAVDAYVLPLIEVIEDVALTKGERPD